MAPPVAVSVIVPEQVFVVPIPAVPQATLETVAEPAALPVPESDALVFVPLATLVVRVTVRVPVAPAVNVIGPRLQELPEESVAPAQVPAATVKSPECEPLFMTGVALSTTAPPVAVIVAVPEQFEAIPTVPEQLTPLKLSAAVPYVAVPDRVAEPAVPLEGVTVSVAELEVPFGVNVTGPSLQLAPLFRVCPGAHAPETVRATLNSLACAPLNEKIPELKTIWPPEALTVMLPLQVFSTPTLPEQDKPEVSTKAVPATPVPVTVPLPPLPELGTTATVMDLAPTEVGANVTLIRLQLAPLASA